MTLSIIVPTLNEGSYIVKCLQSVRREFRGELLVVDGGSNDGTPALAMEHSARIYTAPRGLAAQCNEGAKEAMGEVLLFLSADSCLKAGWLAALNQVMASPNVAGGGFRLSLDDSHSSYRVLEFGGNFRSRYLGIALADQGLFVRKAAFWKAGGFNVDSQIPHAYLSRALKPYGEFVNLQHPIASSTREWKRLGVWATTWQHILAYFRYRYQELPPYA